MSATSSVLSSRNPRKGTVALVANPAAADEISASLIEAITEGRLAPGARLVEEDIGRIFGVSRTLVRQALQQLAAQKLVVIRPAKGAIVAVPSIDEARQVFAVRRMLEVEFVREFAIRATPEMVRTLRNHLQEERTALDAGDIANRSRLLAEFHCLMAHLHGNEVLADLLSDLTSRCQLITLIYQTNSAAHDSSAEHAELVDAIAKGDADRAALLMDAHLRHVEESLEPREGLEPRSGVTAEPLRALRVRQTDKPLA